MCGEYCMCDYALHWPAGSPPHVWGIPITSFTNLSCLRITPTCVGNTAPYPWLAVWAWDHPHMCGEYSNSHCLANPDLGSPPHVWGILTVSQQGPSEDRITPTCVGNTSPALSLFVCNQDHPHMCGEYTKRSQYWCHS